MTECGTSLSLRLTWNSWQWRLSKYSVIHLIIFFTRRDKKQVKKKQTKKKGELGDKPVKVKRLTKGFKSLFLQQAKCSLFSCTVCTYNSPFLNGELKFLATENRASFQLGLLFLVSIFPLFIFCLLLFWRLLKGASTIRCASQGILGQFRASLLYIFAQGRPSYTKNLMKDIYPHVSCC